MIGAIPSAGKATALSYGTAGVLKAAMWGLGDLKIKVDNTIIPDRTRRPRLQDLSGIINIIKKRYF